MTQNHFKGTVPSTEMGKVINEAPLGEYCHFVVAMWEDVH